MNSECFSEDPRLAELLKPIKDLTANFDVPLSQFLDRYYTELKEGLIKDEAKVNFAEAGLFLQGSVSVYSKKVEFLWQSVLKMLEFLSQRQAMDEELRDGSKDGNRNPCSSLKRNKRGEGLFLGGEFLPLLPDFSSQTLIKASPSSSPPLNFICVTPYQLVEKEGKELKPPSSRVNIYTKSGMDLLGPKEDFRVNAQYSSETGVIGDVMIVSRLTDLSVSLCDDASILSREDENIDDHFAEDVEDIPLHHPPPTELQDSIHTDQRQHAPSDYVVEEMIEPLAQEKNNNELRRSKRRKLAQKEAIKAKEKPSLAEIWEPIKPHEAPDSAKNVLKTRRTTLLNRGKLSSKLPKKASTTKTDKKTLSDYYANSKNAINPSKKEAIANIPPELNKEAVDEEKERKTAKKNLFTSANVIETEEEAAESNPLDDVQNEDGPINWEDPTDFHDPHTIENSSPSADDGNNINALDSYEELVVKGFADYVAQSQDYIDSTDLAKRVAAWHEEIHPKLDAVENRGSFDIHTYGTKIIDSFPNDNRKSTISFKSVVENVEIEEVSRYFLSCLMLANTQNLDLESRGINHLDLTLLTKKRHHEELMASQEGSASSAPSRKRALINKQSQSITNLTPVVEEAVHQDFMNDLDKHPDQGIPPPEVQEFAVPKPIIRKRQRHRRT